MKPHRILPFLTLLLALCTSPFTWAGTESEDEVSTTLLYMKGRELVLDGQYETALPILERAQKGDPDNAVMNHQLGELYLRLGNLEKAEDLCRRAVQKDPTNTTFRATLGGVYASREKFTEAKEQYLKIVELEPNNTKAPLLIGILEAESGKVKEAIQTLTKAIESNSDNTMALFYRAKIYIETEQTEKAVVDLERCLSLRPSFVEAGLILGMLYERVGKVDDAIATYNKIQGDGRFRKRLAQLYLQKNEWNKALAELIQYEKVEPDDYTARVKIGLLYFELKRYDEAIAKMKEILKEQPQADNLHFYLAAIHEETKNYAEAEREFLKVSADSTFFRESMLHVGYIIRETKAPSDGQRFAKKLIDKHGDVVEFYDMLASFYELDANYSSALSALERGLVRFPEDEKLSYFRGAIIDKLGDRAKAITVMKKIIEKNQNNAHALNFLGYSYAEQNLNLEEAENLVRKAQKLRPNDGYIIDSLGWVLFRRGKVDEAIAHLNAAAELQPQEPVIFEHLGDVYLKRREHNKAQEMYRKAASLSVKKRDKQMVKKLEGKLASMEQQKDVVR